METILQITGAITIVSIGLFISVILLQITYELFKTLIQRVNIIMMILYWDYSSLNPDLKRRFNEMYNELVTDLKAGIK